MLMLRDLSDLAKLEDLRESTNARDDIMQQYDHMSANTLYASFALANIYPLNWLENELKALHRGLFKRMHDGLEKAMFVVARAKDLEEACCPGLYITGARQRSSYWFPGNKSHLNP